MSNKWKRVGFGLYNVDDQPVLNSHAYERVEEDIKLEISGKEDSWNVYVTIKGFPLVLCENSYSLNEAILKAEMISGLSHSKLETDE